MKKEEKKRKKKEMKKRKKKEKNTSLFQWYILFKITFVISKNVFIGPR